MHVVKAQVHLHLYYEQTWGDTTNHKVLVEMYHMQTEKCLL